MENVIVLDFGGQYNQLIARRVRELNVYCELLPYSTPTEKILDKKPIGIIFTGGPSSVFEENAPSVDKKLLDAGIPVLGICYGCQLFGRQRKHRPQGIRQADASGTARTYLQKHSQNFAVLDEPYLFCGKSAFRVQGKRHDRYLSRCGIFLRG